MPTTMFRIDWGVNSGGNGPASGGRTRVTAEPTAAERELEEEE